MTHRYTFLAVLIAAGAASSTLAAPPPIETTTLKNGLRVVLAPDPEARAADVAVWYETGPRFEKSGQAGITHLFERLMFHATEASGAGEYRRLLNAEGAITNTLTTPDYTSFFATVAPNAVELPLRLEAERMEKLRITESDLEGERRFVIFERRTTLDASPVSRGLQKLFATAFPGHGYGWPVLGVESDLRRITLEDATAYYRDRYAPGNAVVTVVGRFDPATTLAAIRKHFGALPRRGAVARATPLPAPQARAEERVLGRTTVLVVGWRAPAKSDPASDALELLSRVLTSSSQSPLGGERFVQTRTGFDARRDGSLFYAVGLVGSAGDSTAAEQDLVNAVEKLAFTPVAAEELDRAKRAAELEWLNEQQSVRGRARALGEAMLVDGDARAAAGRVQALRHLTADDLMAVAQKVFVPASRTVVWMKATDAGTAPGAVEGGSR